MALLITGGCGYIGSHIAVTAALQGMRVITLDVSIRVPSIFRELGIIAVQGDCGDALLVRSICKKYPITGAIHCAALIDVGESVHKPAEYYDTNIARSITLINTLISCNVKRFIFSSSCAVYGIPHIVPIPTNHARNPINPYGRTKLAIEWFLEDIAHATSLRIAILRYFNAAGGSPEWGLGEAHEPESHLIPRVINAALLSVPITIYGTDYETPDGTAIRDYVHVKDLAIAHLNALNALDTQQIIHANLGTGSGYSVAQIIDAVEKISGTQITRIAAPRRAGDPPILVADTQESARLLDWQPRYSSLNSVIESAYLTVDTQREDIAMPVRCQRVKPLQ